VIRKLDWFFIFPVTGHKSLITIFTTEKCCIQSIPALGKIKKTRPGMVLIQRLMPHDFSNHQSPITNHGAKHASRCHYFLDYIFTK